MTWARVIWEEGTSVKKMSPSDWPKSMGHFLDQWLIWETPVRSATKKPHKTKTRSSYTPRNSSVSWFMLASCMYIQSFTVLEWTVSHFSCVMFIHSHAWAYKQLQKYSSILLKKYPRWNFMWIQELLIRIYVKAVLIHGILAILFKISSTSMSLTEPSDHNHLKTVWNGGEEKAATHSQWQGQWSLETILSRRENTSSVEERWGL